MSNFTSEDIRLAQESERKYGVPASVTLAQYALESEYGKSNLARTKNNYFGMRNGSKGWQTFDSKADSFDAHGKLLSGSLYSSKTANAKTVEEYVNGIAETYAPSSDGNNNYAGQIMSIINANNLTQYDTGKYGGTAATGTTTTGKDEMGFFEEIGYTILGKVIYAASMVGVVLLAIIFFMGAFDMKLPTSKGVKQK